jgi:site-specific recombinase XerD
MPRLGLRVLKTARVTDVDMLLKGSEGKPRSSIEGASRGRDAFVITLVTDTGMRTSEVAHLDVGSIAPTAAGSCCSRPSGIASAAFP